VQFHSEERGTRVKDRAKNGASKRAGRGFVDGFLSSPPPLSFFRSRSIFCAAKTENPVPRSAFARPKPDGNASYAGYDIFE